MRLAVRRREGLRTTAAGTRDAVLECMSHDLNSAWRGQAGTSRAGLVEPRLGGVGTTEGIPHPQLTKTEGGDPQLPLFPGGAAGVTTTTQAAFAMRVK